MTRFRAVTLGNRKGPWLPTKEMAKQEAIEAGEGTRSPYSGTVFLSAGTVIEDDPGEIETTREQRAWAFALDLLAEHLSWVFRFIDNEVERPIDDLRRRQLRDAHKRIRILLNDSREQEERRRAEMYN